MSPLGNPSGQQLGRGSHLSTCRDLGATGSGAAGPDPSPAHVGPGCRTQSSTLTPKARFFHGHSKSPDLEHQKETFPVWHRALRAREFIAVPPVPGQPLHLLQPLQLNHCPGLGRRSRVTAKGEELPLQNLLCTQALLLPSVSTASPEGKGSRYWRDKSWRAQGKQQIWPGRDSCTP